MISDAEMRRPVSFPGWRETLEKAPNLESDGRERFRRAICGYLKYLKERHICASLASAKTYFDEAQAMGGDDERAREGVRWFFRAARRNAGGTEVGGRGTLKLREKERSTFNAQRLTLKWGEGKLRTSNVELRTPKRRGDKR